MAKLNVVIPAVDVLVDGIEYRKVDRKAQAGDVVKVGKSGGIGYKIGDFYAVYTGSDGRPAFIDNDSDERRIPLDKHPERFEVYERVPVEAPKPMRLTVGDYARVIGPNDNTNNYEIGSFVRIVYDNQGRGSRQLYEAERADGTKGNYLRDYQVVRATEAEFLAQKQPVASADDVIVHEGRRYRKVARKANVGEVVLITEASTKVFARDVTNGLVTKCVVDPGHADYTGADITVTDSVGDAATAEEGTYVVLEPLEPAKPVRLKVGEYAKVVNISGFNDDSVKVGDIYLITEDDNGTAPFYGEPVGISKAGGQWFKVADIARTTDAEVAEVRAELERKEAEEAVTAKWSAIGRKVNEYKRGDIVKSLGTCNGHKADVIGEVVYDVRDDDRDGFPSVRAPYGDRIINLYTRVKLVTPVEQRFDR
ncbi:hypothetical protein [Paenibacillus sp. YIM B09110]|uniref:hypothetical protein n=1 Tax=Paenibacillus sp. YIM B09110 TaxID=3126102 RepID=UPI00301C66BB